MTKSSTKIWLIFKIDLLSRILNYLLYSIQMDHDANSGDKNCCPLQHEREREVMDE